MIKLSGQDVARIAYGAGFRGEALTTAVAVAKAESGWIQDRISDTNDYGLWQINRIWQPEYFTDGGLRIINDASYNAFAAYTESAGGTNWRPWYAHTPKDKPYGSGPYRQHLTEAASVVNSFLGMSNLSGAPMPGQPGGGAGPPVPGTPGLPPAGAAPPPPVALPWKSAVINLDDGPTQLGIDELQRRVFEKLVGGRLWTGLLEPVDPALHAYSISTGGLLPSFEKEIVPLAPSPTVTAETSSKHSLQFMFNPYEITVSYSGNPDILPIAALDKAQADAQLPIPSNTVISFLLYFDRTYEVMKGNTLGVLTDVQQLEFLCGIKPNQPTMLLNPLKFFLGNTAAFHFIAIVQSIDVNYTHFSEWMVPMRCEVTIQAQRISSSSPFASESATEIFGAEDWKNKVLEDPGKAQEALGPKK